MSAHLPHGPARYRVCVWHIDSDVLAKATSVLAECNFDIAASGRSGAKLVDWVCSNSIDLIVTGDRLDDVNGIEALLCIADCKAVPSLMIVHAEGLAEIEQVLSDHVMSFLTEPLRAAELAPNALLTLRRFYEMEKLKGELTAARSSLADSKICYLAKCRMMREYDLTEPVAHQRLQRIATDGRIRLAEAARRVLDDVREAKPLPTNQSIYARMQSHERTT